MADNPEKQRELEEKEAQERMEERMTLRHKNTSKWARAALKRGASLDSHTRKAVQEQLRLGQELRDAMDRPGGGGGGGDGEEDEDEDEDEDSEGEDDGSGAEEGGGRGGRGNRKVHDE